MSMVPVNIDADGVIQASFDEESGITRASASATAQLNRSEVECQLDAAHKYKRSVATFLKEAIGMATLNRQVAESCIYSLPRDGKMIAGPSVRLAEICLSAYGNLQAGARVVGEDSDGKTISAQGVVWDMERNVRVVVEVNRRITTKTGRRFSDDMVVTTGNAAASIALRNATFRVVPRAYVDTIYQKVREVAVGDAKTLEARRAEIISRLGKMGVTTDRILARLERRAVEDIGLEDLEVLIGLGTAIKHQEQGIDDAFPPVAPAPVPQAEDGKRISLRGKKGQEQSPSPTQPEDPPAREMGDEQ